MFGWNYPDAAAMASGAAIPQKSHRELLDNPVTPLPGVRLRGLKAEAQADAFTLTVTAALFRMNKQNMVYHIMNYYSALKRKRVLTHSTT